MGPGTARSVDVRTGAPPAEVPLRRRSPSGDEVALQLVAGLGRGAGDAVFGGLNDLVLVVGPHGCVEYANPVAGVLLGVAADTLVGCSVADLVHPDDLPRARDGEAGVGTSSASVGVAAPIRLRHAQVGWRWLELSSGRLGGPGATRTIVTGRVNDDQRSHERIVGLMTAGATMEEVADALPGLADWRLPAVPFGIACDASGPTRHVTGHPAAVELLRAVAGDAWWPTPDDDDQPATGAIASLGPAAQQVGRHHGLTTWVAVRVRSADGAADAVVLAATAPGTTSTGLVVERVRRLAGMARLVVEWGRQRAALERAARVDPLTGVANRSTILATVGEALAHPEGGPVAVLSFDLDGFARVNGELGHDAGDAVLVQAVRRIEAVLDPSMALGRVGGDELLAVVRGPSSRTAAELAAHAAIDALRAPFTLGATSARCGLSVGVALTDGREDPRPDAHELLARADGALGMARSAGGGRVVVTCGPPTT